MRKNPPRASSRARSSGSRRDISIASRCAITRGRKSRAAASSAAPVAVSCIVTSPNHTRMTVAPCHPEPARPPSPLTHPPTATTTIHCRMPTYGQRSAESRGQRLPALVWKIHLLHGAQTRLVQNAAITGGAPGTLSRLGTERIQGQCAALVKITQEIPVSLQACHGGQRGEPGRGGPGILLRL